MCGDVWRPSSVGVGVGGRGTAVLALVGRASGDATGVGMVCLATLPGSIAWLGWSVVQWSCWIQHRRGYGRFLGLGGVPVPLGLGSQAIQPATPPVN